MSRGTEPRRVMIFRFSFLLLQPTRETDCYAWPDSKIGALSWMRPSRFRFPRSDWVTNREPGFSVSSTNLPARAIGTVRSVDRRGVPGGRRSPPWLKELQKLVVKQMVAVL